MFCLQVPIDFNFLKTFDMFIKCHKVFHLDYCPAFNKMMYFIDYFLFENKNDNEAYITVTMRKLAEKLNVSDLISNKTSPDPNASD